MNDVSSESYPFSWNFRLSRILFWVSRIDVDLSGMGIEDGSYNLSIEAEIPHPNELDSFSLVWGALIKTLHVDLLAAESFLVFAVQSPIAKLLSTEVEGDLIDGLSATRFPFSELPAKLKNWLSNDLASLKK